MTDTADTNWLHAEVIECPHCQAALYRVDHSPFYDEYFLYCEQCANRVEVSYYDPVTKAIGDALTARHGAVDPAAVISEIERRLRPCTCGGHFRSNAARRCYRCGTEIIIDASGIDLWPGYYSIDPDEAAIFEEISALVHTFEEQHIRRDGIWQ